MPAAAQPAELRLAFWRIALGATGPGIALRDILDEAPRALATARVIADLAPDVLVLSGVDHDAGLAKLRALRDLIAAQGHALPHLFARAPNRGRPSGIDLNGDGIAHGPEDAHGFGRFTGQDGLAVLARHPVDRAAVRDFTAMKWRDLPDARLYAGASAAARARHRLSSAAHWVVPLRIGPQVLRLLVYHASPPVLGGHPTRNRNRNHDETAFWLRLLNGDLDAPPPSAPIALLGDSNIDPVDGAGAHGMMRALLAHPALQDPRPASRGAVQAADLDHAGPPATDTVDWDAPPGNLRVSYVLPGAALRVRAAGVAWPAAGTDAAARLARSGTPHKPVWVDVALPPAGG